MAISEKTIEAITKLANKRVHQRFPMLVEPISDWMTEEILKAKKSLVKRCPHCKETKPLSEFYKTKAHWDGLSSVCKVCHKELQKVRKKIYYATPKGKFHTLKDRAKQSGIEFCCDETEFCIWLSNAEMKCHYCKCDLAFTGKELNSLNFERRDNNGIYELGNMVLSCLRCNIVKGSWFTEKQMLKIAERYFVVEEILLVEQELKENALQR